MLFYSVKFFYLYQGTQSPHHQEDSSPASSPQSIIDLVAIDLVTIVLSTSPTRHVTSPPSVMELKVIRIAFWVFKHSFCRQKMHAIDDSSFRSCHSFVRLKSCSNFRWISFDERSKYLQVRLRSIFRLISSLIRSNWWVSIIVRIWRLPPSWENY